MTEPEKRCQWPSRCPKEAVTTYTDAERKVWKLCHEHRLKAKRRKA